MNIIVLYHTDGSFSLSKESFVGIFTVFEFPAYTRFALL